MNEFLLRSDLQRSVVNGFAWPLGIVPGDGPAPPQGYTLQYAPAHDDDPDTYTFRIIISHDRLTQLVHKAFNLLPDGVRPIVEVGSRDAYRSVDVYVAGDPISRDQFLETWQQYEPILLEDGAIAAGVNCEDPFIEVFVDHLKQLIIETPLAMRDEVEQMLQDASLSELSQPWPDQDRDALALHCEIRPVMVQDEDQFPDLDDLLMTLRYEWGLDLMIDPDSNVDDTGKPLGQTLWQATVFVDDGQGTYNDSAIASLWATAGSLREMHEFIDDQLREVRGWGVVEILSIDRIAYDERPDELCDLSPRRGDAQFHLLQVEFEGRIVEERRGR